MRLVDEGPPLDIRPSETNRDWLIQSIKSDLCVSSLFDFSVQGHVQVLTFFLLFVSFAHTHTPRSTMADAQMHKGVVAVVAGILCHQGCAQCIIL